MLQWGRDEFIAEIVILELFYYQGPLNRSASSSAIQYTLRRVSRSPLFPTAIASQPSKPRAPPGFREPPRRSRHRVTNTGYSLISPSMYRASSLVWISSILR